MMGGAGLGGGAPGQGGAAPASMESLLQVRHCFMKHSVSTYVFLIPGWSTTCSANATEQP